VFGKFLEFGSFFFHHATLPSRIFGFSAKKNISLAIEFHFKNAVDGVFQATAISKDNILV